MKESSEKGGETNGKVTCLPEKWTHFKIVKMAEKEKAFIYIFMFFPDIFHLSGRLRREDRVLQ